MLIPACDHFNQKDVNAYHFLLIVSTPECNNNKTRNPKKKKVLYGDQRIVLNAILEGRDEDP